MGRKATELPSFIIRRLPVRYTFDNNYFNHRYRAEFQWMDTQQFLIRCWTLN